MCYCNAQFTEEEDELQQIRGLGTDIAVVGFSLTTFSVCNKSVITSPDPTQLNSTQLASSVTTALDAS